MLTVCSIDFYELCRDHSCKLLAGEHDLGGVCDSLNLIYAHVGSAHGTESTHIHTQMWALKYSGEPESCGESTDLQ